MKRLRFPWQLMMTVAALLFAMTPRGSADDRPRTGALDNDSHLVARWAFDETTGATVADSSGKGHVGTLEGGKKLETQSVPGRIGRALALDGGEGVKAVGYKGVTSTTPRTIAFWIKTTSSGGEVISWGLDDAGKMCTIGFIRGHLGITPMGGYLYMKEGLHDGAWHHVAIVVRPGDPPNLHDDAALFAEGEPAVIDDIGLLDLWPIDTGAQLDVRIGRGLKGQLDDLRIYDRALSGDEVKALAHP